jgi:hypothetical protein
MLVVIPKTGELAFGSKDIGNVKLFFVRVILWHAHIDYTCSNRGKRTEKGHHVITIRKELSWTSNTKYSYII